MGPTLLHLLRQSKHGDALCKNLISVTDRFTYDE